MNEIADTVKAGSRVGVGMLKFSTQTTQSIVDVRNGDRIWMKNNQYVSHVMFRSRENDDIGKTSIDSSRNSV